MIEQHETVSNYVKTLDGRLAENGSSRARVNRLDRYLTGKTIPGANVDVIVGQQM